MNVKPEYWILYFYVRMTRPKIQKFMIVHLRKRFSLVVSIVKDYLGFQRIDHALGISNLLIHPMNPQYNKLENVL